MQVYCVNCKHFRISDSEWHPPYCRYEDVCNIFDFEDSRPFSERPYYKPKEDLSEIRG